MARFLALFLVLGIFSCSKNEVVQPPPPPIPGSFDGVINEIGLTPIDLNTPDKGTIYMAVNNTVYQIDFDAVTQSASNAILKFASDTILIDQSREFASFDKNTIAYNPVGGNLITISFTDGNKITGAFNLNTSFGGVFGETLINTWRTPGDPGKPNQKAKDDIINLVHRYADKDGPGTGTTPQYVFVKVTNR